MKKHKPVDQFSPHIAWCPNGCGFKKNDHPERLRVKNLNKTTRCKYCVICKFKLEYLRVDTPEGRAARQKKWYDEHIAPTLASFGKEKAPPKTAAERMRDFRARKRSEFYADAAGSMRADMYGENGNG